LTALAMTAYPLSREFRRRFEEWAGEPVHYVNVAEFRRDGLRTTLVRIRAEGWSRVLVPLEHPASGAVAPMLATAALVAHPAPIVLVDAELDATPVSRRNAAVGVAALVPASFDAQAAIIRARFELRRLLLADRLALNVRERSFLYLNANLWFGLKAGGAVAHIAGIVNGFATLGYDVEIAAPEPPPLVDDTLPFHRLPVPASFGLPIEANSVRFSQAVAHAPLPRLGFVYQRMSVLNYAGVELTRRLRVPLVLEYNGSEAWIARHWRRRPLRYDRIALTTEAVSLRHAALVVTVSNALGDDLVQRGVEPDRIVVQPNGVDAPRYDPALRDEAALAELGVPPGAVVATFVGTFGQWHGAEVLAKAILQLWRDDAARLRDSRLHFLLIGDGLKMPEVRALLGEVPTELVTLTGLVPQEVTPRYLLASDITVSPHVRNSDGTPFFGSPTKLFEYMAAGTAIVASDLDQIGSVLRPALRAASLPPAEPGTRDESLALLVEPGSVAELAAGIRFLAEHGAWRHQLGRRARERAVARHTWTAHVRAIEERLPFAPARP